MSSGAFALYIDQTAGGGPNALIRRVIPLPPISNGDTINFNQVRLSLTYDDFGSNATAIVRTRILNDNGVRLDQQLQVFPGRTVINILPGDLLASFEIAPSSTSGVPRPAVTALVEYND
jgi:hypothetical protein